jgi:TatA/E family protein of Tat protein translocase
MFGSIGGPELVLIFVVALLVFGPRKLPELGRAIGKGLAEFRKASNDLRQTLETEVARSETPAQRPPAPAALTAAREPVTPPQEPAGGGDAGTGQELR